MTIQRGEKKEPGARWRLIATADAARTGILSDQRESKELSSDLMLHQRPCAGIKAKKKLIATFAKLRIESTHSKQRTSHFSNRNKKPLSAPSIVHTSPPPYHDSRIANHNSRITSHDSRPFP